MSERSDASVEDIIDYHAVLIREYFADEVSQIYFGDVGIYPPSAFQNRIGEQRIAVSLQIDSLKPVPRMQDLAGGLWDLHLNIVPMANMVPEFQALPEAAFAERRILAFTTRYAHLLMQTELSTLHGRVTTSAVEGIDYEYMNRGDLAVRGAAIQWRGQVYINAD